MTTARTGPIFSCLEYPLSLETTKCAWKGRVHPQLLQFQDEETTRLVEGSRDFDKVLAASVVLSTIDKAGLMEECFSEIPDLAGTLPSYVQWITLSQNFTVLQVCFDQMQHDLLPRSDCVRERQ